MKKNIFDSTLIHTSDALIHSTPCRPRGQTIAPSLTLNKRDARFHCEAEERSARRGLNATVPA